MLRACRPMPIMRLDFTEIGYLCLTSIIIVEASMSSGQKQSKPLKYIDAGVNIDEGEALIEDIAPHAKRTKRAGASSNLGGFGGLFDIKSAGFTDPILVAATDGVGTKLELAKTTGLHHAVGIDLVAMCANDILAQGATPLFFLDYLSMSKLKIREHSKLIESIAIACKKAKVSLIGGETAEMPGIYSENDFDLAGFAVGIVDRLKKLPKKIEPGDLIYGLPSSGPHSNGFTLIRKLLEKETEQNLVKLKTSLITPTRLYSDFARDPLILNMCSGFAHITGGGILDNLPRIFKRGITAKIRLDSWQIPSSLKWAIKSARLSSTEALQTFNCGIGFIAIVPINRRKEFEIQSERINERVIKIGEVINGNQLEFEGGLNIE